MSFCVLITRKIPEAGIKLLQEKGYRLKINDRNRPLTRDELKVLVRDCDGIITLLSDTVDKEIMDAAPNLRVIANYAVGYNNINVDYATRRRILVTNTPDVLTPATADLVWALLMAVSKRIVEADAFVRVGKFKGWAPELFLGHDVTGKTLGIIGAGRIGQAVSRRAKGFEMTLLYYSKSSKPAFEAETGARRVSLEDLLQSSDFVSLHCPLTEETYHLLNEQRLKSMKSGSILINTARGPVVDEVALVQVLKHGPLAGAGLDVYEHEPQVHPELLKMKNVVLLPHIGSATTETRNEMARMVAHNIIAVLEKGRPVNPVNMV